MHGGTIAAANTTVAGATGAVFTIRLPREITLAARAAVGDAPGDGEPAWMDQTPSLEGVQVLVVEDDYDVRELLGTILQRCGAQVRLTASVPEGLTAFDEQRPDVIVSDIEMAKEDGYSFIRRIRALRSDDGGDVPAAALTAYATPSDRQKILGAGFNMHVAKPVQPAELALVVANLAARPTQKPFTSSA
jgi:CheY-like chemotaxis protein